MEPYLTTKNISKEYAGIVALSPTTITLPQGSFSVIVGPSGCGKSTLLKILAGIELPDSGTFHTPEPCTMVFQNGSLLPWRTVRENILLGLQGTHLSTKEQEDALSDMIQLMHLEEVMDHHPRELSGGQRQRVGIARALISQPRVLLLDEPFSALDVETTEHLHAELLRIWKERNLTILMISHNLDEAVALADTIFVMKHGAIVHEESLSLPQPRSEHFSEKKLIIEKLRNFMN